MVLSLPEHWIWDSWYAREGGLWHGYFLKAPRSLGDPELRHFNVEQGHATSADLTDWTHHGTCLAPSEGSAWDDYTTWTGSVVHGDDGLWHYFYTGSRRSEDGLYQRIGHAIGTDMHHWERVDSGLCLDLTGPNADVYEADHAVGFWHDRAMRDPWVMKDPEGEGWLMYFTARASGVAEPNAGGCIGFATSPDLHDWTLQPPIFTGGFGQLEVPQVFEHGGRWYCLFCTAAEHFSKDQANAVPGGPVTGTHYLIGNGPRGPWRLAEGPFLDGALPCRRYASRIVETDDGLVIMGFADRPEGTFVGHVMDPERVVQDADGTLKVEAG
ncbi:MAG: levansucrase [Pseudomonadota bacterium]